MQDVMYHFIDFEDLIDAFWHITQQASVQIILFLEITIFSLIEK